MRIRIIKGGTLEVIGSCELDYRGGDAHHFLVSSGNVVLIYRWAVLGEEGEVLGFLEPGEELSISPRFELMLEIGDFEHPNELPKWKAIPPKRIIDMGSFK